MTTRYFLEIHAPGRAAERLDLAGRVAFVVRGGAHVPLPARECPSELHLLEIEPTQGGALVSVPAGAPGGFAVEGEHRREAQVPWGGEVFWENLRLAFVQVVTAKERSPVALLGLVGILLCGGFALAAKPMTRGHEAEPSPPELTALAAQCPSMEREPARRMARAAERDALARREQSAFITADALAAHVSFLEAEACYQTAGDSEDATRLGAIARDWAVHLNADYAASRLRLERALVQHRDAEALQAVRDLERLLSGHPGPYREWLGELRIELEGRGRRAGS